MSELVEQVARAISKAEHGDEGEWELYTGEARAALSVLEPRIEALRKALLWCSRHAGGEIADDAGLAELKYVDEVVRLRIEVLERELAGVKAELERRDRNETRNCINWGPCSAHDGRMADVPPIGERG